MGGTGMENEYTVIGKPRPIGDAALKVTGQKIYVGDMELPGMLYAKVLLSTVPHARIKSIDTSAAEALPGVKAVATYKNTPQVRYNSAVRFIEHKLPDTERIFDDTVRFVGDRVAAVAAESPDIAKKAVNLIKVEYEALPVITDVEEAISRRPGPFMREEILWGPPGQRQAMWMRPFRSAIMYLRTVTPPRPFIMRPSSPMLP